ncbi:glycosyl transferase [Lutibacter litoralis]|nr:glycosyl transferase [Lutibacter litoralis]
MQQTSFDFEILIHDDCSDDGTKEIIENYVEKYPNLIKPMYQAKNQYSQGVRGIMARFNFPRAKGKYIALCEGDDYWTDPLKLQKQVDFLEANEEYSLCFTAKSNIDSKGVFINEARYGHQKTWTAEDVLNGSFIAPTQTIVSKNLSHEFSQFCGQLPNRTGGDRLYTYFYALKGKLKYIDANTANYRIHGGGVWSGLNDKQQLIAHITQHNNFLKVVKKDSTHYNELKRDMFRVIITKLYFSFFNNPLKTMNHLFFVLMKYKIGPIVFLLSGKDFSVYYMKLLQSKFKLNKK